MNKTEMINYLTKEIETLSKNTMDSRSKISFSLLIGPFIVFGSIIVSIPRTGLTLKLDSTGAWIAAIVAGTAFLTLGMIAGQVEEGAWQQCNRWRQCIIKIQSRENFTENELKALILENTLVQKVARGYTIVFLLVLITFGATTYLASKLVRSSAGDSPSPPSIINPSSSPSPSSSKL